MRRYPQSMDDTPKNSYDDQPKLPRHASPVGGFAVLGVIVILCVVLAYYLSSLMSESGPPAGERIWSPTDSPAETDQPVTSPPQSVSRPEPEAGLSQEDRAALAAQIRALGEIGAAISSFKQAYGRYPANIDELTGLTGFNLPDSPVDPNVPIVHVAPGDFYPGGFTYVPYVSRRQGPVEGFILVGYFDRPDKGVTIERPAELVWPYTLDPLIELPFEGVSVAMGEGAVLIELTEYSNSTNESEDQP